MLMRFLSGIGTAALLAVALPSTAQAQVMGDAPKGKTIR